MGKKKNIEVSSQSEPLFPGPDLELKAERVQLLQVDPVRKRVSNFVTKLASCDHQRIRVDLTGTKVVLSVQGAPRPGQMDDLMQAALELGQVA